MLNWSNIVTRFGGKGLYGARLLGFGEWWGLSLSLRCMSIKMPTCIRWCCPGANFVNKLCVTNIFTSIHTNCKPNSRKLKHIQKIYQENVRTPTTYFHFSATKAILGNFKPGFAHAMLLFCIWLLVYSRNCLTFNNKHG